MLEPKQTNPGFGYISNCHQWPYMLRPLPISSQTTLASSLYAPATMASMFLILKQQICSHTRVFALALCLEHFTPNSLHCKQRGQIERGQRKSKLTAGKAEIQRLRRRSAFPTQWSKVKEVSLRPKLISRRLAFCQQDGYEASSSFNSKILVS